MSHPYHHAVSSARRYGGTPEDYIAIHSWFDESKAFIADVRHRALRHHAEGIFMCEKIFGVTVRNSAGREVPVRFIGEQHVTEDLGRIPSVQDWFACMRVEPWMSRATAKLSRTLAVEPARRFLNSYRCDRCQIGWDDQWDCACNDKCPDCNAEIEPHTSVELTAK